MSSTGPRAKPAPRALVCSCMLLLALGAGPARAAGVLLYEVGTQDVGYASAGYGSRADAPVTVLSNPAGLTRLEGVQVEVGAGVIIGSLRFDPNANTTVSGNDGGNAIGVLPNGGIFASFAASKAVRFGLGVFSNFGLSARWDSGWVGRYYTTESTLAGLSILPGVGWRIVDGLSIGGAINVMYGTFKQTVAVNNAAPQLPDGSLAMSASTWGVGGNVGILYQPGRSTRIGLTYTSPVKLSFSAPPTFSGLGPFLGGAVAAAGLDTALIGVGITVPQTVLLSAHQAVSERWAVMADLGWQNWTTFGQVELQVSTTPPRSLTTALGYRNAWHAALGAEVWLSDSWQFHFGAAYDSSITDDQNRSLALPIADAWRLGIGARWAVDPHWTLGASYEPMWGGSPTVYVSRGPLAGTVSGTYQNMSFQFLVFDVTWKS